MQKYINVPKPGEFFTVQEEGKNIRRPIDKNTRMNVWRKYFGYNGKGKCFVCRREIFIDDFQVGHNKARAKGGSDNISNLRPICGPCNRSMGTMSIEAYKKKYYSKKTVKKISRKKRKKKSKNICDLSFKSTKVKFPKIKYGPKL